METGWPRAALLKRPSALLVVALLAAILVSCIATESVSPTPSPSNSAAPSRPPSAAPSPTPTAPPAGFATYENPTLGYRITLPEAFRRYATLVVTGPDGVGVDFYTRRTELEERELCLSLRGSDLGSREWASDVQVRVTSNVGGVSALEYVSAPNRRIVFTSVEPTTIDGHEAAKVVHQPSGDTSWYAIRANDRIYELSPGADEQPSQQPKGWLDQIAASFRAIAPEPFPTPIDTRTRCGN